MGTNFESKTYLLFRILSENCYLVSFLILRRKLEWNLANRCVNWYQSLPLYQAELSWAIQPKQSQSPFSTIPTPPPLPTNHLCFKNNYFHQPYPDPYTTTPWIHHTTKKKKFQPLLFSSTNQKKNHLPKTISNNTL